MQSNYQRKCYLQLQCCFFFRASRFSTFTFHVAQLSWKVKPPEGHEFFALRCISSLHWNVVLATTRKQKEIIIKNYCALNKLKEKQATRNIKPLHGVRCTTKLPDTKLQNSVTYLKKRLQGTDKPFFFSLTFLENHANMIQISGLFTSGSFRGLFLHVITRVA